MITLKELDVAGESLTGISAILQTTETAYGLADIALLRRVITDCATLIGRMNSIRERAEALHRWLVVPETTDWRGCALQAHYIITIASRR